MCAADNWALEKRHLKLEKTVGFLTAYARPQRDPTTAAVRRDGEGSFTPRHARAHRHRHARCRVAPGECLTSTVCDAIEQF